MATDGGGKLKTKRYNDQGKPNPRRTSYLGLMVDTVKGILGGYKTNTHNTSNHDETGANHSESIQNDNLGQSYLQSPSSTGPHTGPSKLLPPGPHPGPSKLLPQMPVGLPHLNQVHRLDTQITRSDGPPHRLDTPKPRMEHTFSSEHLPFMPHQNHASSSMVVNGGDDRSEFSECSVSTSGCSSMGLIPDQRSFQDPVRLPESRLQFQPDFNPSRRDSDFNSSRRDSDAQPGHTIFMRKHVHVSSYAGLVRLYLAGSSRRLSDNSFLWSGSKSTSTSNKSTSSPVSHSRSLLGSRSRAPSFNVSIFGNSLSKSDKSGIVRNGPNDSHFYSGRTMFGGSASQKRKLEDTSPTLTPSKRQVRARPLTSSVSGVSSSSARRILSTLERMSSPLKDAKKIPSYNSAIADSPLSFTPTSFANAAYRRSVPYRIGASSGPLRGPPVHAIATPGRVQIAKNYNLNTSQENTREPSQRQSAQVQIVPHSYKDSGGSCPGKLKQQKSQHYSSKKDTDNDIAPVPDLPTTFKLPVTSLPKFEFSRPASKHASLPPACQSSSNCSIQVASSEYVFTSPITLCRPDSVPDTVQNFQFSSPIVMNTEGSNTSANSRQTKVSACSVSKPVVKPDLSFNFNPSTAKRKAVDSSPAPELSSPVSAPSSGLKAAEELKSGSVMDVLSSKYSTTSTKSSSDLKSASVMDVLGAAKKPLTVEMNGGASVAKQPCLSELFKKPSGTWECDVCMIHNKQNLVKCAACETPKPGSAPAKTGSTTAAGPVPAKTSTTTAVVPDIPVDRELAERFKKPEGSWECDTCMVNNNASALKCIACETPKPGQQRASSFTSAGGFKVGPKGGFQLDSLASSGSTPSPFSAKPIDANANKTELNMNGGFKFGVPLQAKDAASTAEKTESSSAGGFKFGQSMTDNTSVVASDNSGGFKFGQSLDVKSSSATDGAGGFKFGQSLVDKAASSQQETAGGFKFGQSLGDKPAQDDTADGFKFGQNSIEKKSESRPAAGVTFGTKTDEKTLVDVKTPSGGFMLGQTLSSSSAAPILSKSQTSNVNFSMPTVTATDSNTVSMATGMFAFDANKATGNNSSTMFGGQSGLGKPAEAKSTFAIGSAVSTATVTQFGFNQASATTTKSETKTAASFNFGTPQSAASLTSSTTAPASTPVSSLFTAPASTPASSLFTAPASTPASSLFTAPASTPASSLFTFGTAAKTDDSKTVTPAITFGQPSQGTGGSLSAFGTTKPAESTTTNATSPMFSFGAPSTAPSAAPATNFSFSAKPTDAMPKPAFNFMVANSTSSVSNTSTTSNLFSFSNNKSETPMSASPSLTGSNPFQFGLTPSSASDNSATTTTAASSMFVCFGQSGAAQSTTTAPPASTTLFSFGQTTQAQNNNTLFNFGQSAPSSATMAQPGPAFGAPATVAQPGPAFGAPATVSQPGAAFGAQSTAPNSFGFPKSASTPAFGSTDKPSMFGTAAPSFGNPTPTFGAASTPAPSFGSTVNSPAFGSVNSAAPSNQFGSVTPGFQFGATQNAPASAIPAPAAPAVFSFGQSTATAPSAVFNFGGAAQPTTTTNTASGFGSPAPPSFNFSATTPISNFQFNAASPLSGANPFSASSSQGPRRQIKKGVRKLARK